MGDFLAALSLVGTIIDALLESSHASSSFPSLIDEVYALESALLRVKRLDLDDGHNSNVEDRLTKWLSGRRGRKCRQKSHSQYGIAVTTTPRVSTEE